MLSIIFNSMRSTEDRDCDLAEIVLIKVFNAILMRRQSRKFLYGNPMANLNSTQFVNLHVKILLSVFFPCITASTQPDLQTKCTCMQN